jgi:uncharacterized protein (TIGR02284 family)
METNHQVLLDLNYLYTVNADRCKQYANAREETSDGALRDCFLQLVRQSADHQQEIAGLIQDSGGQVEEGTTVSGGLYNLWIDVRSALSGGNAEAIIKAVQCAERANIDRYEELLAESQELPEEVRAVLERQLWQFRNALRTLDRLEQEFSGEKDQTKLNSHAN